MRKSLFLTSIQILNCEKASVTAQIKKDISYISPKNGYQELIRINDEGEKVTIFQKQNEGKQKEFVLLCEEQNELTIIIITGNLTLQEIQSIVNKN